MNIASYNCSWNNFVDQKRAWNLIHGQWNDLGIKFDPSHSRYAGRDYLQEMRDWGHRFYHVHLKGSLIIDGKRFDDPPAGRDQNDWNSFMAILYAHYNRGLSNELHSHNWNGELGRRGIRYTFDFPQAAAPVLIICPPALIPEGNFIFIGNCASDWKSWFAAGCSSPLDCCAQFAPVVCTFGILAAFAA